MTYEFCCTDCGVQWEVEQKMNDEHISPCPTCHQDISSRVTGGSGTCFVDHRNWNPSQGFADNDRRVNKRT